MHKGSILLGHFTVGFLKLKSLAPTTLPNICLMLINHHLTALSNGVTFTHNYWLRKERIICNFFFFFGQYLFKNNDKLYHPEIARTHCWEFCFCFDQLWNINSIYGDKYYWYCSCYMKCLSLGTWLYRN